jgi:MFS family permease
MSAFGAGSLVAGLVLMRGNVPTDRRLAAGGLALGTVLVLLGLSSWYAVSLGLMVVGGMAGITASVTANTRLQLLSTDAYRGRVMSLFVLLMGGTTPIGAILLGSIAQAWGIRAGLLVFGTLAIAGLVTVLAFDRGRRRATARSAEAVLPAGAVLSAEAVLPADAVLSAEAMLPAGMPLVMESTGPTLPAPVLLGSDPAGPSTG